MYIRGRRPWAGTCGQKQAGRRLQAPVDGKSGRDYRVRECAGRSEPHGRAGVGRPQCRRQALGVGAGRSRVGGGKSPARRAVATLYRPSAGSPVQPCSSRRRARVACRSPGMRQGGSRCLHRSPTPRCAAPGGGFKESHMRPNRLWPLRPAARRRAEGGCEWHADRQGCGRVAVDACTGPLRPAARRRAEGGVRVACRSPGMRQGGSRCLHRAPTPRCAAPGGGGGAGCLAPTNTDAGRPVCYNIGRYVLKTTRSTLHQCAADQNHPPRCRLGASPELLNPRLGTRCE